MRKQKVSRADKETFDLGEGGRRWLVVNNKVFRAGKVELRVVIDLSSLDQSTHTCVPYVSEIEVMKRLLNCRKCVKAEVLVRMNEIFRDEMKDLYTQCYLFVTTMPIYNYNHNIAIKSWNVAGLRHRTNNAMEGWNHKLNSRMGKKWPNIFKLVQTLKEDTYEAAFQKRAGVHQPKPYEPYAHSPYEISFRKVKRRGVRGEQSTSRRHGRACALASLLLCPRKRSEDRPGIVCNLLESWLPSKRKIYDGIWSSSVIFTVYCYVESFGYKPWLTIGLDPLLLPELSVIRRGEGGVQDILDGSANSCGLIPLRVLSSTIIAHPVLLSSNLVPFEIIPNRQQDAVKEDGVAKEVLDMCKNKFPISDELLESVRKSGSLPDNADENVMLSKDIPYDLLDSIFRACFDLNLGKQCFNECFMTGVGIIKNGELDKDKTSASIGGLLKKKGITDVKSIMANILACGSEGAGLEKCAKSYAIIKCIDSIVLSTIGPPE
uniref:Uncharacterized protein n=1 Tax=Timema bartmani TaxID=61472 RepID=A0A7R9EM97_9NEOP|nr:unnamed protein product [Timema bartmani]